MKAKIKIPQSPLRLLSKNQLAFNGNIQKKFKSIKSFFNSHNIATIWDEQLGIQATVTRREDLKFFFNCSAFQKSKKVLDFGCGVGDMIGFLNKFFPKKKYFGVDLSERYIQTAKNRYSAANNVQFICEDIFKFKNNKFDYIILRLVIQHLEDIDTLFQQLKKILNKNGKVLIIEAVDSLKKFSHKIPSLNKLYSDLACKQYIHGGNRKIAHHLEKKCRKFGFQNVYSDLVIIPAFQKIEKDRFVKMFVYASEIAFRKFGVKTNQELLYRELKQWSSLDHAYAQIGIKYLLLEINNSK